MSVVYETGGQDATQASANGLLANPIARGDDPCSVTQYNYYIREQELTSGNPAVYEVRGFAPFFWASGSPNDDAIAGPIEGNGWHTAYQSASSDCSLPTYDASIPVYFVGGDTSNMGMLMLGHELECAIPGQPACDSIPWNQRLCEIPQGRVAFKVAISLAYASPSAFAGVVFAKVIPSVGEIDLGQAVSAPGYSLNVNKLGQVQLIKVQQGGGQELLYDAPPAVQTLVAARINDCNDPYGMTLEVRTFNGQPGRFDIHLDDQPAAAATVLDTAPLSGPHFGLPESLAVSGH